MNIVEEGERVAASTTDNISRNTPLKAQINSQLHTDTLETVPSCDDEYLDPELSSSLRENSEVASNEQNNGEKNPASPPILKKTKKGYAKLKDLSPRNHNSPRPPPSNNFWNEESNNNVVTIEHNINTNINNDKSSSSNVKSFAKSTKSVVSLATMGTGAKILVVLLGIYAVFTTLTSGFLFDMFLDIPRLEAVTADLEAQVANLTFQVNRLEGEVDELTFQVDRLEDGVEDLSFQNDRYEQSNNNLAGNLTIFKEENVELEGNIASFLQENIQLNVSLTKFQKENDELYDNILQLNDQTNTLTDTISDLDSGIQELENINLNLTLVLNTSTNLVKDLSRENQMLENITNSLNSSVALLGTQVELREEQIDRMDISLNELKNVVSFLNTTATNIDQTFDATVTFIEKLISEYRRNVLYNTRVVWEKLRYNWRCDLNSAFGGAPYVEDAYVPIGDTDYPKVMDYLDEVVFQKMCFNMTDFHAFLIGEFFPVFVGEDADAPTGGNLTVQNLSGGIGWYAMGVFDHYFNNNEEDAEDPVTELEWEEAGFECQELVTAGRGYSFY